MRTLSRIALVTFILVGCVGCDRITKGVVRGQIPLGDSYSFGHDLLRLTHVENSGALLGLGARLPQHVRAVLFTWAVGILSLGPLRTRIFNVADLSLMLGAAVFLVARFDRESLE